MIGAIPVFYTPKMLADSLSFSPSSMKPEKVVDAWKQLGIPLDICEPDPVSVNELALAHERSFVEAVLAGNAKNGFENEDLKIAFSLSKKVRDHRSGLAKNIEFSDEERKESDAE